MSIIQAGVLRVHRNEAGIADSMTLKYRLGEGDPKRYELQMQATPHQTSTTADSDEATSTSRLPLLVGKSKPGARK